MNLRDAKIGDLNEITELIVKCSEQFILPRFSAEGKQNYQRSHTLNLMRDRIVEFQYQVLEQDEKIIGVVGMQRPSHLFHLHVAPELHKKGLGRKLWMAAKERAISLDKPNKFSVNSSLYSVSFYEKLGFVASPAEVRGGVEFVPMSMNIRLL